jgi:hypothetical protein
MSAGKDMYFIGKSKIMDFEREREREREIEGERDGPSYIQNKNQYPCRPSSGEWRAREVKVDI